MSHPLDIQNAIALLKGEGYEIKEPTHEKIKVNNLWVDEVVFGTTPKPATYHFDLDKSFIPSSKFSLVKQAIENAINDERRLYSQGQVDAMMEDTWKAAREVNAFMDMRWTSFADYKATLPLEQKKDDKNMSTVYFDKQVLNPHSQETQAYTNWEQGFMEAANKYFKPQPEAKDNTFVWDDQLVAEFACDLRNNREKYEKEHKSWRDSMGEFKESVMQSKQSPTNPNVDFLEQSKPLLITEDGLRVYMGSRKIFVVGSDFKQWETNGASCTNNPSNKYFSTKQYADKYVTENKPQPSTPQREQEYEIIEYGYCQNNEDKPDKKYISIVVRKSDNKQFKLQDDTPKGKISKFQLSNEGKMYVHYDLGGFDYLHEVLPTPQRDWEIMTVKHNNKDEIIDVSGHLQFVAECYLKSNYSIDSVCRLSDNTVFLIGGQHFINGYMNTIKKFEISEFSKNIIVYFDGICIPYDLSELPTPTEEQTITDKPILFTTFDGVDIKEGDKYSVVWLKDFKDSKIKMWDTIFDEIAQPLLEDETWSEGAKFFSTKEAAQQYILDNKPCISLKEIKEYVGVYSSDYALENLKLIAKEKLNQKQ